MCCLVNTAGIVRAPNTPSTTDYPWSKRKRIITPEDPSRQTASGGFLYSIGKYQVPVTNVTLWGTRPKQAKQFCLKSEFSDYMHNKFKTFHSLHQNCYWESYWRTGLPRGSGITCAAYTLKPLKPRLCRAALNAQSSPSHFSSIGHEAFILPGAGCLLSDQQSSAMSAKVAVWVNLSGCPHVQL